MKRLWRSFFEPRVTDVRENSTFSQSGEDVIVDFLFRLMAIGPVRYLDLGANDPVKFSNSYKFYLEGGAGLLVEPDQDLAARIALARPRDICLAKAVSVGEANEVEFFKMSSDTLSTTKRTTADRYQAETEHRLSSTFTVPAVHINRILEEFDPQFGFNFVSLDVEGMDYDILEAWDFSQWRPAVFCIETLTYTQSGDATKVSEIFSRMRQVGYHVYADTYINTIFVDGQRFVPAQWQNL
ncbi:FkbM family methyltransferase [Pseudorhizobium marinum]|uniref:FkbM family methyltransferase n=1 Tax=Pseudorhizobium marinum TaxID=1496690 RepID=UPI00049551A6|nr:FkbM family methyltransferase [Pseudorhizobium marinum]